MRPRIHSSWQWIETAAIEHDCTVATSQPWISLHQACMEVVFLQDNLKDLTAKSSNHRIVVSTTLLLHLASVKQQNLLWPLFLGPEVVVGFRFQCSSIIQAKERLLMKTLRSVRVKYNTESCHEYPSAESMQLHASLDDTALATCRGEQRQGERQLIKA